MYKSLLIYVMDLAGALFFWLFHLSVNVLVNILVNLLVDLPICLKGIVGFRFHLGTKEG